MSSYFRSFLEDSVSVDEFQIYKSTESDLIDCAAQAEPGIPFRQDPLVVKTVIRVRITITGLYAAPGNNVWISHGKLPI